MQIPGVVTQEWAIPLVRLTADWLKSIQAAIIANVIFGSLVCLCSVSLYVHQLPFRYFWYTGKETKKSIPIRDCLLLFNINYSSHDDGSETSHFFPANGSRFNWQLFCSLPDLHCRVWFCHDLEFPAGFNKFSARNDTVLDMSHQPVVCTLPHKKFDMFRQLRCAHFLFDQDMKIVCLWICPCVCEIFLTIDDSGRRVMPRESVAKSARHDMSWTSNQFHLEQNMPLICLLSWWINQGRQTLSSCCCHYSWLKLTLEQLTGEQLPSFYGLEQNSLSTTECSVEFL